MQLINRERAVVVDVSETEEFAQGHVGGAKNVPVGQLEQRLPEVVKNKSLPLILVCPSGARANRAPGRGQETRVREGPSAGRRAESLERG